MNSDFSDIGYRSWRMLLAAQTQTAHALQRELRASGQVPLDVYDVLATLYEAPEQKLRMSQLAERILFSRSGLTRLVDRLQARGWVEREPCSDDRRGWFTKLTESGNLVRQQAHAHYVPGLVASWSEALNERDHEALIELLEKVQCYRKDRKLGRMPEHVG